jgi:hypothetical protein
MLTLSGGASKMFRKSPIGIRLVGHAFIPDLDQHPVIELQGRATG